MNLLDVQDIVRTSKNQTQIKDLKNHHKSMARDLIADGTLRNIDLARIYNMTETQISIIVNSPCFIAYMAEMETQVESNITDVREDIRLLVPRAARVLREELYVQNTTEAPLNLQERKFRLGVALDVLDRDSGKKKHTESGAKHLHFHQHGETKVVQHMSTRELQEDVFDLISGDI